MGRSSPALFSPAQRQPLPIPFLPAEANNHAAHCSWCCSGGGASKPDALDVIIDKELKKTMVALGQTKKDVLPFWKDYHKIDLDKSVPKLAISKPTLT